MKSMAPFALLSVSDKNGIVPFAEALHRIHGYSFLSSGGTAKVLEEAGLPVTRVSEHTGAPEILGGRVKTLHPRVHGGILAKRGDASHQADLEKQDIPAIDLVVVNLYPFRETVAKPDVTWDQAIENIDIGGPAMVRAAAKNHADVAVLTSPDQYNAALAAMAETAGRVPADLRRRLRDHCHCGRGCDDSQRVDGSVGDPGVSQDLGHSFRGWFRPLKAKFRTQAAKKLAKGDRRR